MTSHCFFSPVQPGRGTPVHDENGDRKVDTTFVGMPVEQWGVAQSIRPALRAPRFEEAAFKAVADAGEIVRGIKVAT